MLDDREQPILRDIQRHIEASDPKLRAARASGAGPPDLLAVDRVARRGRRPRRRARRAGSGRCRPHADRARCRAHGCVALAAARDDEPPAVRPDPGTARGGTRPIGPPYCVAGAGRADDRVRPGPRRLARRVVLAPRCLSAAGGRARGPHARRSPASATAPTSAPRTRVSRRTSRTSSPSWRSTTCARSCSSATARVVP